ncbi:3-hydroxyacyl-CoA dehydrogenase NAD-binding domain-containing protein [Tsukamurella pseudospumae]|uniref:Hydroxylacyl-CoA dehydrogenase n=1 Tax=Tsukamurella pseudospumae TaxID=239498 RepID=A0A137ZSY0_9ACTN|nr:3-hydroxyacyl-CoA dehydrogenase NAD-binding domain-containing protein [Tsukamurella pseudospumae]KXP01294.1 hypothetical protein AXK61_00270 [Tsukamurella pseudospumae]
MNITVIGAGVIGISWSALFLANGHTVTVYDVADDAPQRVRDGIAQCEPTLRSLGYDTTDMTARLTFCDDLDEAVREADVVQENGPERRDFKRRLWAQVEKAAKPTALLLSSSSGMTATSQSALMTDPGRMLIGHPFNPPHMIPLVEVVPGENTAPSAVDEAMRFYAALGKTPIRLRREIPGFAANRLQAALFKESVALVRAGMVTVEELDEIVVNSIGLRWATAGPFQSFHLGGGPSGFRGYLDHFATGVQLLWLHAATRPVVLTTRLKNRLVRQIDDSFGARPIQELEAERDAKQLAVRAALAPHPRSGDGDGDR